MNSFSASHPAHQGRGGAPKRLVFRGVPEMRRSRNAFSLVELLVVTGIIAVLVGLLMLAVQKIREAAARTRCANNLNQIGLAVQLFQDANGYLPPNGSWQTAISPSSSAVPYSVHARILPFLEEKALYAQMNLDLSAPGNPAVLGQRIPVYICPSDPSDHPSAGDVPTYPTTYAAAWGDWFLEDYTTGQFGNGAFPGVTFPSKGSLRLTDITDGTSATVGFAEVKALGAVLQIDANFPATPVPATVAGVLSLGGSFGGGPAAGAARGHISWATDGVYTAFTFVFPPNTPVPYVNPADGRTYDVDWNGGGAHYDYGAITARSYHAGGVNALFMDGSVHFVTNSIPQATWRALGTRNGGEVVELNGY